MKQSDLDELKKHYQSKSTEDLIKDATIFRGDYQQQTLQIIDAELETRKVTTEQMGEARKKVELEQASRDAGIKGIGGWLIIPLLNLIISPIVVAILRYREFKTFFASGSWDVLTSQQSPAYNPVFAAGVVFEIIGSLIWIVLAIITLFYFLKRSRVTPKLFIAWLIFIMVYLVVDQLLAIFLQVDAPMGLFSLFGVVIFSTLWMSYFHVSKRVKATFTKGSTR